LSYSGASARNMRATRFEVKPAIALYDLLTT